MREHRWESCQTYRFSDAIAIAERLSRVGLASLDLDKDLIGYIEDWEVGVPDDIERLEAWTTEDVTLIHLLEAWKGDFFLLAGRYHTIFEQHQSLDTYCSISHPFRLRGHFATVFPEALFWIGFRYTHSFIRVRVHTRKIIAPGETCPDEQREGWFEDRLAAFDAAIHLLDLPLTAIRESERVSLITSRSDAALFCSWPDAFGPCQFEYNSADAYEFLVPASRLAETMGGLPQTVRCYLTGFSEQQLRDFHTLVPEKRIMYRCSVHMTLRELPEVQTVLGESGRIYTTLCEFMPRGHLNCMSNASAIIGVVGTRDSLQIEVRLNQLPLTRIATTEWLTELLQIPLAYAPLSAFP